MITSGSVTNVIKILFASLEMEISIAECDRSKTADLGSYLIQPGENLSYFGSMIWR